MRENLSTRKCRLGLDARKFSCAKISTFTVGGVGPSGVGAGVGHVHFRLFASISFAFGSQHKRSFQWNMGLILL